MAKAWFWFGKTGRVFGAGPQSPALASQVKGIRGGRVHPVEDGILPPEMPRTSDWGMWGVSARWEQADVLWQLLEKHWSKVEGDPLEVLARAREAAMSRPVEKTELRLWLPPGKTTMVVKTPYDALFVDALKKTVPRHDREWDREGRTWLIEAKWAEQLVKMIRLVWPLDRIELVGLEVPGVMLDLEREIGARDEQTDPPTEEALEYAQDVGDR